MKKSLILKRKRAGNIESFKLFICWAFVPFTNLLQTGTKDGLCGSDKTRQILDDGKNMLFFGNNLHILKTCIPDEFVDLIYLDPPFNSNKNYSILFEQDDVDKKVQEKVYGDTWKWDREIQKKYESLITSGYEDLKIQLDSLRDFILKNNAIPDSDMAYIVMMAVRLVELKRALKSTGSIFLHCDPVMSHYLKIIMDAIFGKKNFRNEIVWSYRTGGSSTRYFSKKHDTILFYTKSENYVFHVQREKSYTKNKSRRPGKLNYGSGHAEFFEDEKGVYNLVNLRDVWDISYIGSMSPERVGFPTQKPLKLLKRIIKASSNEGDIILDAFCGSGTTMAVCSELKRKWIGIDLSMLATGTTIERINNLETDNQYYLTGFPQSIEQVKEIIKQDTNNRFKLEYWINSILRAVSNKQQRKDAGVNGTLYFRASPNSPLDRKVLIQVKTEKVGVKDIRELLDIMNNDKHAEIGYLVCLEKKNITNSMKKEAENAGIYNPPEEMIDRFFKKSPEESVPEIPRLGIITIEEMIASKRPYTLVKYPYFIEANQTFHWEETEE